MLTKIKKFLNLPLSRKLQFLSSTYHKIKTQTFYKLMFKQMGEKSTIKNPLLLTPEFITIGKKVLILQDARIEGINTYANKNYRPHIIIEDGVSFQQRCNIGAADTLIIGKNTLASYDVMITDIDHAYTDINLPVGDQPLIVKKTHIGENCFIGSGAKILAGTILGNHCIVGTNSVVRGEFLDYSLIVGNPAKTVKRYNNKSSKWEKIDKNEF